MQDRIAYQGITFDDVLLEPGYSELAAPSRSTSAPSSPRKIPLNIPILSSPDGHRHRGASWPSRWRRRAGLGVIHKNMSIEEQTREVDKVKRSENGIIVDPITLPPDATVGQAREIMERAQHLGRADHRQRQAPGHPHPPRPPVPGVATTCGSRR